MNRAVGMLLILSACATLVTQDGFSLEQSIWQQADGKIRSRASFELACPAEQLTTQVLDIFPAYAAARQVGVSGCGKRAIYVKTDSGWVANSAGESSPKSK